MSLRLLESPILSGLTFRVVTDDDLEFLYQVYASTRQEELALTDWTDAQKEEFLRMQFRAQHQHYVTLYSGAGFHVIEDHAGPIGRLYIAEWADELRVIDIALLPQHRRRGTGSTILRHLLAYAAERGKSIRLHVETFNPALQLYERLGFRTVEAKGPYFFMEWSVGVTA